MREACPAGWPEYVSESGWQYVSESARLHEGSESESEPDAAEACLAM